MVEVENGSLNWQDSKTHYNPDAPFRDSTISIRTALVCRAGDKTENK